MGDTVEQSKSVEEYGAAAAELVDLSVKYGLSLVTAIAILAVGYYLAGWVSRTIRKRLGAIDRIDPTLVPVVAQITRYAILVFTIILVLAEFGIQTTSIIAMLGAAGLAIGLALQGTLQNVAAGMMVLLLRPYQVGEFVETAAGAGAVDEIGLFMTRMRTPDGIYRAIPNSEMMSGAITNYSRLPTRRLSLTISISYDDDIDKARDLILELARKEERIDADPEPVVLVTNLGESSVDLELRAWIKRDIFWDVRFDLIREAKYALDAAGITIPYPHRQIITRQA